MGRARDIANLLNSGTFLTPASASATYLSQTSASSTYLALTGGSVSGNITVNGRVLQSNIPAFSATAEYGTAYSGQLSPVVFGSVDLNVGNHYNPSTGVFTVPFSGKYFFFTQGHRNALAGYSSLRIQINGNMVSNAWCNSTSANVANDSISCSYIGNLNQSDSVQVNLVTSQTNYIQEKYWKFMGYFIG